MAWFVLQCFVCPRILIHSSFFFAVLWAHNSLSPSSVFFVGFCLSFPPMIFRFSSPFVLSCLSSFSGYTFHQFQHIPLSIPLIVHSFMINSESSHFGPFTLFSSFSFSHFVACHSECFHILLCVDHFLLSFLFFFSCDLVPLPVSFLFFVIVPSISFYCFCPWPCCGFVNEIPSFLFDFPK